MVFCICLKPKQTRDCSLCVSLGADNIRNITASPTTGIDPQELLDVAPLTEALQSYISNSPDMYELPRKFNVAFDNGGNISVVADTNDIGFVAAEVGEGRSIPAGVYFRVLLCGITGHHQFVTDCGILLRPDQTVAAAAATIMLRSVSHPSAKTRIRCGTTKKMKSHMSQKCHTALRQTLQIPQPANGAAWDYESPSL
jgi:sulfite reductase beta subunit-like hemoprotein